MKALLVVVLLVAASCVTAKTKWFQLDNYRFEDYVQEFSKVYEADEYEARKAIFETNLAAIKLHNQDSSKSWKNGVNQFTDMTSEELNSVVGYRLTPGHFSTQHVRDLPEDFPILEEDELPSFVDWTTNVPNILTEVKDQGRCGGCWAFASVAAMESYLALASGELHSLSVQQIISCAPNPLSCGGNGGCYGATAPISFQQAMSTGLASMWTYPYASYNTVAPACRALTSQTPAIPMNMTGYVQLPKNEYLPLLNAVARIGPIVVSVSSQNWHYYESGVFQYGGSTINHLVLLVGYGTENGLPYWKIRNSYGANWGESGYMKIYRNTDCTTDFNPQAGSDCVGGPTSEIVCGTCGLLFDSSYPLIYPRV